MTTERHILIVDDDVLTACALKEHFEKQGFLVTVAEGCNEALISLRAAPRIHLMILDHLLQDGYGTDLLSAMANGETIQKPGVIMSSCVADANNPAWEALRKRLTETAQGLIKAYVNKPYSISMMDAMVNLILSTTAIQEAPSANEISSGDYLLDTPLYPYARTNTKT